MGYSGRLHEVETLSLLLETSSSPSPGYTFTRRRDGLATVSREISPPAGDAPEPQTSLCSFPTLPRYNEGPLIGYQRVAPDNRLAYQRFRH